MTWDERYTLRDKVPPPTPSPFVVECLPQLPRSGRALDVACGEGRHAVLLAEHGLEVTAMDHSEVALSRISHPRIAVVKVDLEAPDVDLGADYRVVVVTYFLHRPLFPKLMQALAPGGALVMQTYTTGKRDCNPRFLLQPGELQQAFPQLAVSIYREDEETAAFLGFKRD